MLPCAPAAPSIHQGHEVTVVSVLAKSLQTIQRRWPGIRAAALEEPVFVFAACWRSGSTLLQRMLLKNCLVWGEPYGPHALIWGMARQICYFNDDWPREEFFVDHPGWSSKIQDRSTANVWP